MTTRYQAILDQEKRWRSILFRIFPRYQFSNDLYEAAIRERLGSETVWADLGCGKNELAHELGANCRLACGLDAVAHKELRREAYPFIRGDVGRLPLREGRVDLLSSNMLLEHLKNPPGALREMRRALKPGGWIILRTPNEYHPLNLILRLVPESRKARLIERVYGISAQDVFPTLYRANSMGRLRRLCREAGFDDVEVWAVEDVHTAYGFFFWLSLAYYLVVRMEPFALVRTNFVVLARKT